MLCETIERELQHYIGIPLLLSNPEKDGLYTTKIGANILVRINPDGMPYITEITRCCNLVQLDITSIHLLAEIYLCADKPAPETIISYLITPEMEVERIFNRVRHRYLTAIYLSNFDNPHQYMNAKYNKAFQSLAGIAVTQLDGIKKTTITSGRVLGFALKQRKWTGSKTLNNWSASYQ